MEAEKKKKKFQIYKHKDILTQTSLFIYILEPFKGITDLQKYSKIKYICK